jgi:hypothetical protein
MMGEAKRRKALDPTWGNRELQFKQVQDEIRKITISMICDPSSKGLKPLAIEAKETGDVLTIMISNPDTALFTCFLCRENDKTGAALFSQDDKLFFQTNRRKDVVLASVFPSDDLDIRFPLALESEELGLVDA